MRFVFIILIGITFIFSQENNIDSVEVHSCDSPLIQMKNSDENRSLKMTEIIPYMVASIKCRLSDRGKAKAKSKSSAKRMVRLLGAVKAGYKPKRKSKKRRRRKNKS